MARLEATTLADVAARAGVNKVTASVVLGGSGRGNTRVSETTRQRIVDAARALNYHPNALARSLRRRQSHCIGLYLGGYIDTRDLFLSEIVSGLQQGCEQNQRDFLMHGTFRGPSTDAIFAELVNGKVDGLIVHVPLNDPLMARLAASHLPVVAVANAVPGLPSVVVDDAAGSRILAEYLAGKGHRHVLYAACPFPLSSTVRRYEAFCQVAQDAGIAIVTQAARTHGAGDSEAERWFLRQPAAQRPTAVVCWNDYFAFEAVERFRASGLRVPEEVAVVGFDGASSPIPPAYRLTTIRAPWHEVARTAVNLVVAYADGASLPPETVLPVEFVAGVTA